MNRPGTMMLPATRTALFLWTGQTLGGAAGLAFALVLAGFMNAGAVWFSGRVVLRICHAREVTAAESPEPHGLVRELAMLAEARNAFATGRNPEHGVLAVTEGLPRWLGRSDTAGVIAHEVGHIRHRGTLMMALAATFTGAPRALARAPMHAGTQATEHLYIENPFPVDGLATLFPAHPRTEDHGAGREGVAYGRTPVVA